MAKNWNRQMPPPPSQVEEDVNVDATEEVDSDVELPPAPKKSKAIEVVALQAGFANNHRKKEGDKFTVPSMQQLGFWMKCVDPVLEKQHRAIIEARKREKPKDDAADE